MTSGLKETLDKEGYAVIENLLSAEECDELRSIAMDFTRTLLDNEAKVVFSPNNEEKHFTSRYFLDSNDKIRAFYNDDAIGPDGEWAGDPSLSVNKVGHALHYLHPAFRRVTYSDKVNRVCLELGLTDPAVVQSMYIYKNPGIHSNVKPHRDASYLFTEPIPPVGFWIAIEDANLENGCLQVVPGSQKDELNMRVACHNENDNKIIGKDEIDIDEEKYVDVPVKKGACILIHGNVVHKSRPNASTISRHAYTFHIIEKHNNVYSEDNWLKEGPGAPFVSIYTISNNYDNKNSME